MFGSITTIMKNQKVQKTIAGISGFAAGRVYPACKQKIKQGVDKIRDKWNKKEDPDQPVEDSDSEIS